MLLNSCFLSARSFGRHFSQRSLYTHATGLRSRTPLLFAANFHPHTVALVESSVDADDESRCMTPVALFFDIGVAGVNRVADYGIELSLPGLELLRHVLLDGFGLFAEELREDAASSFRDEGREQGLYLVRA
jgi:hypothetical protein